MSARTASTSQKPRKYSQPRRWASMQSPAKAATVRLFLVYDDVHDVGKPREPRGGLHVRIYGVAVQHSRAGQGAAYELPPVVAKHRSPVADAWQDALAPAGKAREEVRLYEALGHQQLRFRRQPVDDKRRA